MIPFPSPTPLVPSLLTELVPSLLTELVPSLVSALYRPIIFFDIFKGLLEMVYAMSLDAGSGVMGLLFHAIGSKTTVFCYSITSAVIFVAFLLYIYFAQSLDVYEKLPLNSDEEDYTD